MLSVASSFLTRRTKTKRKVFIVTLCVAIVVSVNAQVIALGTRPSEFEINEGKPWPDIQPDDKVKLVKDHIDVPETEVDIDSFISKNDVAEKVLNDLTPSQRD